jgi:hypothetical protein
MFGIVLKYPHGNWCWRFFLTVQVIYMTLSNSYLFHYGRGNGHIIFNRLLSLFLPLTTSEESFMFMPPP